MGLTIEINSEEDMCRLMCDNYVPSRNNKRSQNKKKDTIRKKQQVPKSNRR